MSVMAEWLRRIAYLLNRSKRDAILRAEIESHRAMMEDPKRFGNPLVVRERAHDVWGWRWLDDIGRDLRFATRTLVRAPGFSIVTIVSLALATGATTAIFSIVNGVLLKPLPFEAPDRLVRVRVMQRVGGAGPVAWTDLQEFRRQSAAFERFSSYELSTRLLETTAGSERVTVVVSDRELFPVLGVEPIVGRTFTDQDPLSVAVLSEALWTRQFDRDPGIVGRTIALSGNRWDPVARRSIIQRREVSIVGVMPERFQYPYGAASGFPGAMPESRTELWMPNDIPGGRWSVVARMKAGVAVRAAEQELLLIQKRQDATSQVAYRGLGVQLTPLTEEVLGAVHRSLWLLFGAVGLVLLAACANVANLLLARTTTRAHEIVTRGALGASPSRLVRQFLTESLLLSLAGGAAGIALAYWGVELLVTLGAAKIPRAHEVSLDWQAFVFLFLVCVVTSVVFGLAPALAASHADVQGVTKESGGRTTVSSRYGYLRDMLVVAEVALAFVLAFGAAGVMRELGALARIDSGMNTENVITLHLTPRVADHDYYAIEERVNALPGVRAAGLIQMVPLQNWGWTGDFHVTGRPKEERPTTELRTVTSGYFAALGIPVRGRPVTEADTTGSARMLLVNEALARAHFGEADPIGRELDRGLIVGVVGDVRQARLDRPAVPEIYQGVNRDAGIANDLGMSLVVRTSGSPEAIVPAVRAAVREVNPILAIFNVKTMDRIVADSLWELNLYRWLIGLFAALALTLATIGLYGVISYGVTSRRREFAVRLALGSDRSGVARLVLLRGARLATLGLVAGAVGALALLPLLRGLPANIRPDVFTFAAIAALLIAIAFVACLVPALRVATVNPAAALRHD
jgi:predicted permease